MAKCSFTVDISGREHLEQWKPIPDFEGYYEASNLGRIRSIDRYIPGRGGSLMKRRGIVLKTRLVDNGYVIVMMSKHNSYQNRLVHRLVLSAFVGPAPDGMECRHINGIRTDNRLENLQWGTHSENSVDQVRHGTHRNVVKTHCLRGHRFDAGNTYIRPGGQRMCRTCRAIRDESRKNMRESSC